MPIQSTLAGSLSLASLPDVDAVLKYLSSLSPRVRFLLGAGGLLAFIIKYLRVKNSRRATGGGCYIEDLSKVGSSSEHKDDWNIYDVIIVGGGTSGCALAARLSEDPNIRVLLLEAGRSGTALMLSRTPSMFGRLFVSKHVHRLRTEPQVYARGKKNFWPRGSSINAQMAQYGAPGDYDEWAQITGDESWAWKNLRRYGSFCQALPQVPELSVCSGPIRVGYNNYVSNLSRAFIKSCINIGIPLNPDFNGPQGTMGVSRVMTYIDDKYQRVSSESAYLTPNVLARENLTVATNATVTRIIFEKVQDNVRAIGVEFAKEKDGKKYRASAKRDVVLCAGAVHSPHVLMLSGVGPAEQLRSNNIPVVLDLLKVGQNLVDHPVVDLYFKDKHNASLKWMKPKTFGDTIKVLAAFVRYFVLGLGGPLATNFGESAAFVRTDDPKLFPSSKYPEQLRDSTSAKDSPDLEFFTTPFAYKEHGAIGFDVHTFALHCYLVRPLSTGAVLLRSNDPWQQPSVNPNYLQNPEDLRKLVRGVRVLLAIARTEPLAGYLDHTNTRDDLDHQLHLKSDAEITELIKDRVETVYHPTSTCRMAPREQGGVVDTKLKVYGIRGLRVCDASIFPFIISGHTAGGCYAIAEKLADDLKAEYAGKSA
ncbi:L-sorbose 1-dehydrogenase [Leucoagaricus sp. SymC.cos]|nr:L-sorbose 1-dehydrogenase [Leucoagaricus sp. SymC.cos]